MEIRNFKIGWRLLVQDLAYSAVAVIGLSVGFAACILMLSFVYSKLQYNSHIPDSQQIYMLTIRNNTQDNPKWWEFTPFPLREVAMQSGLAASATVVLKAPVKMDFNGSVKKFLMRAVDPSFQEIFGVKAIAGDLQAALSRPDSLALTLGTAQQLFGETQVIGKTVLIDGKPFHVAALLNDPPATTTVPYSVLAGIGSAAISDASRKTALEDWSSGYGKIYVKLSPKSSPQALTAVLQDAFDRSPAISQIAPDKLQRLGQTKMSDLGMIALPDVFFSPDFAYAANSTNDDRRYGDRRGILGLTAIALLILLLASTNYVNLASVRTLRRQREIAVRKLMGASAARVTGQFLVESVFLSVLATCLGLLLAWALLPVFSDLINKQLVSPFADVEQRPLVRLLTPTVIGYCLLLGTLVGVAAGAYPAWIAYKVRIASALSGRGTGESSGSLGQWLRRVFTVLQFSTALGVTGAALAIVFQIDFAIKLNPGFDPAPLLTIAMPFDAPPEKIRSLREALTRLENVSGVTSEVHAVGSGERDTPSEVQISSGERISVSDVGVGPEFFKVYGVPALVGRVFDPTIDREDNAEGVVLNRTAVRALGFPAPEAAVGQLLNHRTSNGDEASLRVLGVSSDIRHESLRSAPQPIVYKLQHSSPYLTLRAKGNMEAVQQAIRTVWSQYFPNDTLDIRRPKTYIERSYAADVQLAKMLSAASVVAIAIAAFGIYVLSAYSVRRRAKEIVLRKLHGAGRMAIGYLVGREFLILIVISALIGLPVAAITSERFLAGFVERAPSGTWALPISFAIAVLVAMVSILRHTVTALRMSPAEVFRE